MRRGDPEGEGVLRNRYEVPGQHALKFEGVIQSGTKYYILVEMDRVDSSAAADDLQTSKQACSGGDPADGMDVSVILGRSGLGFVTWPCDRAYTYRERLTSVAPDGHVISAETTST